MKKAQVKSVLNDLVFKRFETKEDIENHLKKQLNYDVELSFSWQNDFKEEYPLDYLMVGCIDNEDVFCDFDIYYLLNKQEVYFITEVAYNFEELSKKEEE